MAKDKKDNTILEAKSFIQNDETGYFAAKSPEKCVDTLYEKIEGERECKNYTIFFFLDIWTKILWNFHKLD